MLGSYLAEFLGMAGIVFILQVMSVHWEWLPGNRANRVFIPYYHAYQNIKIPSIVIQKIFFEGFLERSPYLSV